jgi:hypothetical protein
MPDLKNVVEVGPIASGPRAGETHVTDPPRGLAEVFAGDFGVCLPCDPVVGKEAVHLVLADDLPAHEIDARLADDAYVPGRLEHGLLTVSGL